MIRQMKIEALRHQGVRSADGMDMAELVEKKLVTVGERCSDISV